MSQPCFLCICQNDISFLCSTFGEKESNGSRISTITIRVESKDWQQLLFNTYLAFLMLLCAKDTTKLGFSIKAIHQSCGNIGFYLLVIENSKKTLAPLQQGGGGTSYTGIFLVVNAENECETYPKYNNPQSKIKAYTEK